MGFGHMMDARMRGEQAKRKPFSNVNRDLFSDPDEDGVIHHVQGSQSPALYVPESPAIILPKETRQTEEQSLIIDAPLDGTTRVIAYAGTGKTWTLVEFAKKHPQMRGLYVAFNKAIQEEGKRKFPKSVSCKTSHAIAYRAYGHQYSHKLSGDLRLTVIISLLGLPQDYPLAILIRNTINGYCSSDLVVFPQTAIAPDHTPTGLESKLRLAAALAYKLWNMMCDPKQEAPMIHDGYLKLFQLSGADLGYDYILFDEAQDSNPVTTAIVKNQRCPVVVVGDPYQSIYAFRGADNALDVFEAKNTFYLTNSFRFGPEVANVASELLRVFCKEKRQVIGRGFDTQLGPIESTQNYTALCRTNAEVFNRAAMAIQQNQSIAFIGGVKSYNFDKIVDAYHLCVNEPGEIRDPFLKSMSSFTALEQYAQDSGDPEAKRLVSVVMLHMHAIPMLVETIMVKSIPDISSARRAFSTAHKAKGLDLENVVMADDYKELISNNSPIMRRSELPLQEVHLTYVSVTRAVKKLQLNMTVRDFMRCVEF
jgi:F-box protein, helicase, 18